MKKLPCDIFFILSRGRSGSSLLASYLNQVDNIAVAPEAQFLMLLKSKYGNVKLKGGRINSFLTDLQMEDRIANWNLELEELQNAAHSRSPLTFSEISKLVYEQYAQNRGKSRPFLIGDKNPQYSLYIGAILKAFPKAKFIHLVRDPVDNVNSFLGVDFDSKDVEVLAWRWVRYNKEIEKWKRLFPENFFSINYEGFLNDPVNTYEDVCGFLGIEAKPDQVESFKGNEEWETSFRSNLNKPIDKSFIGKGRKAMSIEEVKKIEFICKEHILAFGYPYKMQELEIFSSSGLKRFEADCYTYLEKTLYSLPFWFSSRILRAFRKKTGSFNA